MCARWLKTAGFNPSEILPKIASYTKIQGDEVSFHGWEFHETQSMLADQMDFHPEIAEVDRSQLFMKALIAAARTNQMTAAGLERNVQEIEAQYLQQSVSTFILCSTVSIKYPKEIPRINIGECRIEFGVTLPNLDRSEINDQIRVLFNNRPLPANYTPFTVEAKARTPTGASQKAMDIATLLRAVLNLWENLHTGTRVFSGRPKAINQAVAGPISTIHHPNGKLATNEFWYEPSYIAPEGPYQVRDPDQFFAFQNDLLGRLTSHPYEKVIKTALLRYNAALDKNEYDASIIELWSTLELLAGVEWAKYDDLVRRVSFLYRDYAWQRGVLSHLRFYRNQVIHQGRSSAHRDEAVHLLRKFVEKILLFHWYNQIEAKSLKEGCDFLDLPPDMIDLKQRAEELDRFARHVTHAIKFRGGSDEDSK